MRLQFRSTGIVIIVATAILCGFLGFQCYQLSNDRQRLSDSLDQSENKNRLLNQKYKEEKAFVGRLQRENLKLSGQVRQARQDVKTIEEEISGFRNEKAALIKKLAGCDARILNLSDKLERLTADYGELDKRNKETVLKFNKSEEDNAVLKAENQNLNADLKQAENQSQRYLKHNERLSQIAKELVARIEQKEMGSSIMVKERLIQFKRAELENLLQDYLDRIDDEKIVN